MIHQHKSFRAATVYRNAPDDRIRRFLPLVRKLAWQLHSADNPDLDLEDLVQTGLVALTECSNRHGDASDDGFAAYAKLRVRGAMIDLMRRNATISRGAMERRRDMRNAEKILQLRLGRPPTTLELADAMAIDEDQLDALRLAATPLRFDSLNECYTDTSLDFSDSGANGFDILAATETHDKLAAAIAALPERHRLVIHLYFVEDCNLAEIAAILEVSVPRVHQIKAQAFAGLRQTLGHGFDINA